MPGIITLYLLSLKELFSTSGYQQHGQAHAAKRWFGTGLLQVGVLFLLANATAWGGPAGTGITGLVDPPGAPKSVGKSAQASSSQFTLQNTVSQSVTQYGQTVTYTVVLTNIGSTTPTNLVVQDSLSTGLTYLANSASAPSGTTFSPGTPYNSWQIPSLSPGQTLTMTFQARADSVGILYHKASIADAIAIACTSVPLKVCTGDTYVFQLTSAPGRSNYQWYKDGTAISGANTNTYNVTSPGSYSLSVDDVSGLCPDFSCCPFIVQQDTLPTFQASAVPVTCVGNTPQTNGQIVLTNFRTGYSYQYSLGTDFNPAAPLSGNAQSIPSNGVIANALGNPASSQAYTIRVYNSSGCYTDVTVQLAPTVCTCTANAGADLAICAPTTSASVIAAANGQTWSAHPSNPTLASIAQNGQITGLTGTGIYRFILSAGTGCTDTVLVTRSQLAVSVNTPGCNPANNQYVLTGTVSFSSIQAGTLTITDGTLSTTLAVPANTATASFTLSGGSSGSGSHTVTASMSNCGTASTTYMAPAACLPTFALTATPGACQSATNGYTVSGTLSLTNAIAGTATITDGNQSTTVAISAGATSVPYSLTGLLSGSGSHTITAGYGGQTNSVVYTAPSACSLITTLTLTATPGTCQSATNGYAVSGTLSLTNAVAGVATLTDGVVSTTISIPAAATSVAYSLSGLVSGTGSHTVTVSYAGLAGTALYSAPLACGPQLSFAVNTGSCQGLTNTYNLTGTLSLTNAVAGTVVISDGTTSTTVAITDGQASASFSLTGLTAGSGSHTVTFTYAGASTQTTYTAPAACQLAMATSLTVGNCQPQTSQYTVSGVISLTGALAGTATITDGTTSTTIAIAAGQTSASFALAGLSSGSGSHTLTVSYNSLTTSNTYTAPTNCQLTMATSVSVGSCQPQNNQYSIAGTISLTNAVAGTATITDGTTSTTVAIATGQPSASFSLAGLSSGSGSHTVTIAYSGLSATQSYTAPATCQVSIATSVTAGPCQSPANTYAISGLLSLTNAVAGTAIITDGALSTTLAITAGQSSASFSLSGISAGTGSHTLMVSYLGQTSSTSYSAPQACGPQLAFALTTGNCQGGANTYALTGTLSLTNAVAGAVVITDGTTSTTVTITAGQTSASFSLTGLPAGSGSHTVLFNYAGQSVQTTYNAPAACSVSLAASLTIGTCQPATNQYTLTGTLSFTNATAGTATITDGSVSTTVAISAGQTSASFALTGLASETGSHTVTIGYAGQSVQTTYYAPVSCAVSLGASVTAGSCQLATNQYAVNGTLSIANSVAGTAVITDGSTSTTLTIAAGQTYANFTLNGLTSGTGSHTVTVTYNGISVTKTYTAPAACQLTMLVSSTIGNCQPATNTYTLAGTLSFTNAVAGNATISDGTTSTTVAIAAGQPSASFSLPGLASGTGSHTLTISYAGQTSSSTYGAPATCGPQLNFALNTGSCQGGANTYTLTGTLSLTNAVAGSIVITDGTTSTTVAVTDGQASASFSLTGLAAGSGSHTVTITYAGQSVQTTYSAPAACQVSMYTSTTIGTCQSGANTYALTGTLSLTNAIAGIATISDGVKSTTLAIAIGQTTAAYSLSGLTSGTGSHTLTVAYAGQTSSTTYVAPAACAISLAASLTVGNCQAQNNQYGVSGTLSLTNATAGTATISDGSLSTTVAIANGQTSAAYSLSGLTSGTGSHTLTIAYNGQSSATTYAAPASCLMPIGLRVTDPGVCDPATNTYYTTGVISFTNAQAGIATISDGPVSATVTVPTAATSVAYSLSGLTPGTGTHTVVIAYLGQTTSTTYAAPQPCGPQLNFAINTGTCQGSTNTYNLTGTLSLTNAVAGSIVITDGTTSTTVSITNGQTSASFSLTGLAAGSGSHTVTITYAGQSVQTTYSAPAACQISMAISLTVGNCQTQNNQYAVSGTLSLTNAIAGTATITDGTTSTTVAITAGQTSAAYSLSGLTSGTGSHTLTIAYNGQSSATTYAAPASCLMPIGLRVTDPGVCDPATNTYYTTGVISFTNAQAGIATISDGPVSATVTVPTAATSVAYSLSGLTPGTGTHTVVIAYLGQTTSTTYAAPQPCGPQLNFAINTGTCQGSTNTYNLTGTLSLTNAVAGSIVITDGTTSTTVAVTNGQASASFSLTELVAGSGSHTVTITYAGQSVQTTYSAPAACQISLASSLTVGNCQAQNNQYAVSGTLSLTNATAGTATISDGSLSTTVAIANGQTSAAYSLSGLTSGTGSHTLTVAYAGQTSSTTYVAPAACAISLAASLTVGNCQTQNNQYAVSGTLSLTNATAGTATLSDGSLSTTVAIANGQTSAAYSLSGLTSGTGSHTLTIAYNGQSSATTYAAPASCLMPIGLRVTDPGVCDPATNTYYTTGVISFTNAQAGIATISDGPVSATVTVPAAATSVAYSLSGLTPGTGTHTVVIAYLGQTTSTTYAAPQPCGPQLNFAINTGTCQGSTNTYNLTGTLSLTNAVAGTILITDGTTSTTVAITNGQASASFSLTGLAAGSGSHTVTITYAGQSVQTTYSAPAACQISMASSLTVGNCQTQNNQYAVSGTLSLTNATAGTATITDGTNTTTVTVIAGITTVSFSLTGLPAGSGSHTLTVTYAGKTTTNPYTAPAACSQTCPPTSCVPVVIKQLRGPRRNNG